MKIGIEPFDLSEVESYKEMIKLCEEQTKKLEQKELMEYFSNRAKELTKELDK